MLKNKWLVYATGVLLAFQVSTFADESKKAGDEYALDTAHSTVGFTVRHMGITNVRGQFGEYEGKLKMTGDDISSLYFTATIQADSVDTNNERRDEHLRNEDFFEVETYPTIVFHSKGVEKHGDGYALVGHLTIKETTKEVKLPIVLSGPASDPWGNTRIGLEITGTIDRNDYGVAFDGASDRLIGSDVTFAIDLQAIKQ